MKGLSAKHYSHSPLLSEFVFMFVPKYIFVLRLGCYIIIISSFVHAVWTSERQRLRVRGFGIDSVSFDVVDCVLSFSWSYFFVCTFNFYFFCVEIFYVASRIELKLYQRITYFYSDNYIFAINLF